MCVCVNTCVYICTGGLENNFQKLFSHSTFMWILGIELRSPDLLGKHLDLLYYVAGPICHFKIHFVDSAIGQKNRIFI